MATKHLYFRSLPILFNKCTTFYLILTINTNPTSDVTILVKGLQNGQFSFRIFLKISLTLKAHISGTEADIDKR